MLRNNFVIGKQQVLETDNNSHLAVPIEWIPLEEKDGKTLLL